MIKRFQRFQSSYFWTKFDGYQAIQVHTDGLVNIANLKKALKIEFQIEPLCPGHLIADLNSNTHDSPLVAKIKSKTIYIQDFDFDFDPKDTFSEWNVESDDDVVSIMLQDKCEGLVDLSEQDKNILPKYRNIEDGGKYRLYCRYHTSLFE